MNNIYDESGYIVGATASQAEGARTDEEITEGAMRALDSHQAQIARMERQAALLDQMGAALEGYVIASGKATHAIAVNGRAALSRFKAYKEGV